MYKNLDKINKEEFNKLTGKRVLCINATGTTTRNEHYIVQQTTIGYVHPGFWASGGDVRRIKVINNNRNFVWIDAVKFVIEN